MLARDERRRQEQPLRSAMSRALPGLGWAWLAPARPGLFRLDGATLRRSSALLMATGAMLVPVAAGRGGPE
eukprot:731095-Alexandrium_andersonii.AAC.1